MQTKLMAVFGPNRHINLFFRLPSIIATLGRKLIAGGLLVFICHPLFASVPQHINFQHLLDRRDIALGEVGAFLQDHQGFMWIGCREGLIRYDGYEFKFFHQTKPGENSATKKNLPLVNSLFEDSDHFIWVSTRNGIFRFDPRDEMLIPVPDNPSAQLNISTNEFWRALELPTGELVIGSQKGLFVVDRHSLSFSVILPDSSKSDSLQGYSVRSLVIDKGGVLWVGSSSGLQKVDWANKKFRLIKPDPKNPNDSNANAVSDLAMDNEGKIWIGTFSGLVHFDPATETSERYTQNTKDPNSFCGTEASQLLYDSENTLWIASDGGGLCAFEKNGAFPNGHFVRQQFEAGRASSLNSNQVRTVYEDRAGDIWVGNYPNGINFFDRTSAGITTYAHDAANPNSLSNSAILDVREDINGNLWLGTDGGGLNYFDREKETIISYQNNPSNPKSIGGNAVLGTYIDEQGGVWAGAWKGGLSILDPKTGEFFRFKDQAPKSPGIHVARELSDNTIWSIKADRENILWISTHLGGLNRYDRKTETFISYQHDEADTTSIARGVVWDTMEDSAGNFWVGTSTGLDRLDRKNQTFTHFVMEPNNPHSLRNPRIISMYEDRKHRLWFGSEAGLHLLNPDGKTFTVYDKSNGFLADTIRKIMEDKEGKLWISTSNGISVFDPESHAIRNYNRESGKLLGSFHTDAGVISRKGEIIFGGVEGLRIFDPEKLQSNNTIPPIVFTDLKIFADDVAVGDATGLLPLSLNQTNKIVLDYKKNMFQLNFAALNFRDPEKNQYAYKLEGFDSEWLKVGDQRSAKYTNLNPGIYIFKVKGSNNDHVWNNQGKSITIIQLPPPWKTWWAYALYILAAVLLVFLQLQNQRKKRALSEEQNRLLELKVAERTRELEEKNNALNAANEKLENISMSDPLTGLNNRRYLYKCIPSDLAQSARAYRIYLKPSSETRYAERDLVFSLLDIDHFKSINDEHGHAAGDLVLKQITEILKRNCRSSDNIIRWGGEEFLVVSRFTDRTQAPVIAENLRRAVEEHLFDLGNGQFTHRTCSIGFACFPFDVSHPESANADQIINLADHCLYQVKRNQRNGWMGMQFQGDEEVDAKLLVLTPQNYIQEGILNVTTSFSNEWVWSEH